MIERPLPPRFLPAFGMISLVFGHIALLLFFMPVLGLPLGVCGLVSGFVGLFVAMTYRGVNWRWSVAGLAVCFVAITVNVAVSQAPEEILPRRRVPPQRQPVPERPAPPPPARPGAFD
jgi:hypothetical protein